MTELGSDVAERESVEEALRKSEERYRDLFENANDLIQSVRPDGSLIHVNRAWREALGYSEEEIPVLSLLDIIHPDSQAHCMEMFQRVMAGEKLDQVEAMFVTKDGRTIWVEGNARCRFEDGKPAATWGIFHDATERKRVEEALARQAQELARSNAELETFTYSVSHDLKEPLRAIEAFSMFLAEDYGDRLDEEGRRYITVLRDSAVRMKDLIEDLLRLSRLGRVQNEHTAVAIGSLVEDIRQELTFALEEKKVELRVQPDLPTITCDEVHIRQVFKNLISNAIKFNNKPQPVVEVACRDDNDVYTFSIRDNGMGIDPQYHEKIFRIFQRLNRQEDYKDTGVGLTICKKVVEAHQGTIWVESTPGEGSTFFFTVPKQAEQSG